MSEHAFDDEIDGLVYCSRCGWWKGAAPTECGARRALPSARFETSIRVFCCGVPCRLAGNLSLREAGAPSTRVAYECAKCFKRIQLVDEWGQPSPEQLAAYDEVP